MCLYHSKWVNEYLLSSISVKAFKGDLNSGIFLSCIPIHISLEKFKNTFTSVMLFEHPNKLLAELRSCLHSIYTAGSEIQ